MKRMWMLLLLLGAVACADEPDYSALQTLAVQKDGRKKPLDSVAIEANQRISGRRSRSMEFLLEVWLGADHWRTRPVILLGHQELKRQLGLPLEQKRFSYDQLATPSLQAILERAAQKESREQTPLEREAVALSQRMNLLGDLASPDGLALVPHPSDPKGPWTPIPPTGPLKERLEALRAAFQKRDAAAFGMAARELETALRTMSPQVYPSRESLAREVRYNHLRPFGKAMWLYAASFIVLLATWPLKQRAGYWMGMALFLAGVAIHTYGFYLRILISGRPPITNMYESVVWVSYGAAVFALGFELIFRQRYYAVAVAPVAAVMLLLADMFPAVMDPSIGPLVPVLRDNFWLTVHVPAVTLGYSAFAVAMALGHVALGYYLLAPGAGETIRRLEQFIYRAMQLGVLFLAAGTILGGIWAHYAWGRFWGWDPKETWALISLLSYVIPLHGRLVGWLRGFGLSVASVLCFLTVLMAWYGVNFILGTGLHAYGFGSGGTPYVAGFAVFELAFVGFAVYQHKKS